MELYIYITGVTVCISVILLCLLYAILELIRWSE